MGFKLCIAEKPNFAKDLSRVIGANKRMDGYYEGNGYIVTWAVGHLVSLAEPELYGYVPQNSVYSDMKDAAYSELPLIPDEFKLVVIERTKKQFKVIKDLMGREDIDLIIDCGDMGAEGHILQWLIREKAGCNKPIKRFCATSQTDEAIESAMSNLRNIDDFKSIIKGEFCKKKADWILGMSLSRCASIKYNTGINVGRVQSPTLYFIVKRFFEVQNFKVTDYYTFDAEFQEGFHVFWNKDSSNIFSSSLKDSEGRLLDLSAANSIKAEIMKGETGVISALEIQKKATDRPQLFDITELQREGNIKFGYSASVTLATAQALYETHKILSYPRTDSRYITSDLKPYMVSRIKAIGTLEKYSDVCQKLANEGLNIDKKIVDDSEVTDHHALILTERIENFNLKNLIPTPEEKKKGVTSESLLNILELVINRMIISFSKPFLFEQTIVNVTFSNGMVFSASGKKPISLGFKAVEKLLNGEEAEEEDLEKDNEQFFPNISKGQVVKLKNCFVVPKKTTPPKFHTEATLLTAMRNAGASITNGAILKGRGIGTQATRSEIIKKLFDTKYVETLKKGKTNYIIPTAKGLSIIRILPSELYSPKITADWETKIASIAEGKSTEDDFMNDFIPFIKSKVQEIKTVDTGVVFKSEKQVFGVCPWCSSDVYFYKKNDKEKLELYYCSEKCGFSLNVSDNTFLNRLGRKITESEARKFIAKGFINLSCKLKSGEGTYRGEFTFKSRESNGKKYCNIFCEPIKSKK